MTTRKGPLYCVVCVLLKIIKFTTEHRKTANKKISLKSSQAASILNRNSMVHSYRCCVERRYKYWLQSMQIYFILFKGFGEFNLHSNPGSSKITCVVCSVRSFPREAKQRQVFMCIRNSIDSLRNMTPGQRNSWLVKMGRPRPGTSNEATLGHRLTAHSSKRTRRIGI